MHAFLSVLFIANKALPWPPAHKPLQLQAESISFVWLIIPWTERLYRAERDRSETSAQVQICIVSCHTSAELSAVHRVYLTKYMCCVGNREFLFVTKGVARAFWIFACRLKIEQIRQHRCLIWLYWLPRTCANALQQLQESRGELPVLDLCNTAALLSLIFAFSWWRIFSETRSSIDLLY